MSLLESNATLTWVVLRKLHTIAVSTATARVSASSRLLWKKATYPVSAAKAAQVCTPTPAFDWFRHTAAMATVTATAKNID